MRNLNTFQGNECWKVTEIHSRNKNEIELP